MSSSCHTCKRSSAAVAAWMWITTGPSVGVLSHAAVADDDSWHCCLQMGPSGSGKTTMLDTLAGRKGAGIITGSILYAGRAATPQFLRRHTGYVEQFGAHARLQLHHRQHACHELSLCAIPMLGTTCAGAQTCAATLRTPAMNCAAALASSGIAEHTRWCAKAVLEHLVPMM